MPSPGHRAHVYDHLVVVADDHAPHREAIRDRLEKAPGRQGTPPGSYPRFRVLLATCPEETLRLVSPAVSALAVDLALPQRGGLRVIQELRQRRPDLAILSFAAFATTPAPGDVVAAMVAGADHFLEYAEGTEIEHALDLAIGRRQLAVSIARSEAEMEEARERLARLDGTLALGLPGLRPPPTPSAVVPFQEAARRYLFAAAKLFEHDPRGLAQRLGISYFAMRRLLKRYGVPIPGRRQVKRS